MGNKVRIERICEFCGKTFIAKTCKTRFCCKACNDKYYKELIRSDRYNAVTKEVKEEKKKRIRLAVDELEVIQAKMIAFRKTGIGHSLFMISPNSCSVR